MLDRIIIMFAIAVTWSGATLAQEYTGDLAIDCDNVQLGKKHYSHWVNLQIVERFKAEGIDFAFPTQTLHMAGDEKRPLEIGLRERSQKNQGTTGREDSREPT